MYAIDYVDTTNKTRCHNKAKKLKSSHNATMAFVSYAY